MKKFVLYFVFVILASAFVHAQSSVWKVSKSGNYLYIGGSIHILRAQDYPFPKEFDMAFEKSNILVFEANVSEANDPEFMQKMMSFMMLPDGKTIKTVLNQNTYKILEAKCKEIGIPVEYIENFTPFSIGNILTIAQMQKIGFVSQGVDMYYIEKAKDEGKKIVFLETMEFQLKLFYDLGMKLGDEYILQSLDELDKIGEILPSMIAEWRNGGSKIINEMTEKDMKNKFPNIYKTILLDRNKTWLRLIEKYLTTEDVEFVIVGLGHIQGDDGLLKNLKDKGYKVEQIK
jgi:uncharacterized protein YbaP (TraB family)